MIILRSLGINLLLFHLLGDFESKGDLVEFNYAKKFLIGIVNQIID